MKEAIKSIADHFGYESQSRQLIEEMAELTQAINHLWRYDNDLKRRNAVYEELADVEIMIEQIKHLLSCHEEVEAFKSYKVRRQLDRIEGEKDGC